MIASDNAKTFRATERALNDLDCMRIEWRFKLEREWWGVLSRMFEKGAR